MKNRRRGFSLIEIMVVVVIIGFLAIMSIILIANVRAKANDVKRKAELSQIGRLLTVSCYVPDAGSGTYDLIYLINELKAKDEKYQQAISKVWRDPKSGSDTQSNYIYIVTDDKKCTLYANLENNNEPITLPTITEPTPGGGSGVFASSSKGINGSVKYYQVTN